jgi:dimethylamine--corrinoid protein Co-methyltransferase
MGGMRTAGDLVARMELSRNMRLDEAKRYVADKLGVTPIDLSDPCIMRDLREELDIGVVTALPRASRGIQSKLKIEEVLGIKINCCEAHRNRMKR